MVRQWVDARCVSVLKWLNERRLRPTLSRRWRLQVTVQSAARERFPRKHENRGGVFVVQLSPARSLLYSKDIQFVTDRRQNCLATAERSAQARALRYLAFQESGRISRITRSINREKHQCPYKILIFCVTFLVSEVFLLRFKPSPRRYRSWHGPV